MPNMHMLYDKAKAGEIVQVRIGCLTRTTNIKSNSWQKTRMKHISSPYRVLQCISSTNRVTKLSRCRKTLTNGSNENNSRCKRHARDSTRKIDNTFQYDLEEKDEVFLYKARIEIGSKYVRSVFL